MRLDSTTPNYNTYRVWLDGRLIGFVEAADDDEGWVRTRRGSEVTVLRGTVRIEDRDDLHPNHDDMVDRLRGFTGRVEAYDDLSVVNVAASAPAPLTVANLEELDAIDPPPVVGQMAFLTDTRHVLIRVPWDGWVHIHQGGFSPVVVAPPGGFSPVGTAAPPILTPTPVRCIPCNVVFQAGEGHQCGLQERGYKTAWERLDEDEDD